MTTRVEDPNMAVLDRHLDDYWDIAYTEGVDQVSQGTVANEKRSEIKALVKKMVSAASTEQYVERGHR